MEIFLDGGKIKMQVKKVKKLSKLDLRKIQSNKLKQSLVDEKTKIKNLINILKCNTGYKDRLLDFKEEYLKEYKI